MLLPEFALFELVDLMNISSSNPDSCSFNMELGFPVLAEINGALHNKLSFERQAWDESVFASLSSTLAVVKQIRS